MEALAVFFVFCIMCMLFVIMGVMLWFAYKLYRGLRTVKKYTKPIKRYVAPAVKTLDVGVRVSRSADRVVDEVRYIWKGY